MGMKPALHSAYVMGLLSDLERRVVDAQAAVEQGEIRAAAIESELGAALGRFDGARAHLQALKEQSEAAARTISDNNQKLVTAHRDLDTLQRKADELLVAMRAAEGEAQRQIRRSRAGVVVSMEDKHAALKKLTALVEGARAQLTAAQHDGIAGNDRAREVGKELDLLQAQLPAPELYLRLFAARAGRAHCLFALDRLRDPWLQQMEAAQAPVWEVHAALRAGRYRLDTQSALLGGRAQETGESLYAWVAMGNRPKAQRLFALVTDPNLFFHHIFHVFRVWCVGLYVSERFEELQQLTELHFYGEGLRGAYAQAFAALLQRDGRAFAMASKSLVQQEWQAARRAPEPALGVVNVNAVALCRLAAGARLPLPALGETVPRELLAH